MKNRLLAALALLVAVASQAEVSGTNAVTLIADNVENAQDTMWPITIGLIGALVVLGVLFKVGRRAGVRA